MFQPAVRATIARDEVSDGDMAGLAELKGYLAIYSVCRCTAAAYRWVWASRCDGL